MTSPRGRSILRCPHGASCGCDVRSERHVLQHRIVDHAAAPVVFEILDTLNAVVSTGTTTLAIEGYSNTAQAAFPQVRVSQRATIPCASSRVSRATASRGMTPLPGLSSFRTRSPSRTPRPILRISRAARPDGSGRRSPASPTTGCSVRPQRPALRRQERHERLDHEGPGNYSDNQESYIFARSRPPRLHGSPPRRVLQQLQDGV